MSPNKDLYNVTSNNMIRKEYNDSKKEKGEEIIKIIVPSGIKVPLSLGATDLALLYFNGTKFISYITHTAKKVPGFFYSDYRTATRRLMAITSMRQLAYIRDIIWSKLSDFDKKELEEWNKTMPKNLTYGIPKEKLYIKFNKRLNSKERNILKNGLRNYFFSDLTFIFDLNAIIETFQTSLLFLNVFYIIIGIISMAITFFLILVSFSSNIKENSWEFGVLRSIGLNKYQMTRIYIYEALALIISSAILGSIVGISIAIVLVLQFLAFTELPFEFIFPTEMFFINFTLGILTAVFASYFAAKDIREKSIANIIKGLD